MMQSAEDTSTNAWSKRMPSCLRCAERKVKCDRQATCSACAKHDVRCIYRPLPPRRKTKRVKVDSPSARLDRLEAALRKEGISNPSALLDILGSDRSKQSNSGSGSSEAQLSTPVSTSSEQSRSLTETQLVHDAAGSKFIDKSVLPIIWRLDTDSQTAVCGQGW